LETVTKKGHDSIEEKKFQMRMKKESKEIFSPNAVGWAALSSSIGKLRKPGAP
jgi:hypothetical protein